MADDGQARLESWKEIAAYLQRDVRTARRWELEERLPVHRLSHKSRSSVYAYASEIDAWRASRKAVPEPLPLWKTLLAPPRSLAVGVTLALCLVMVGNGIRPQVASAQARSPTARQVWADADLYGSISADGRYMSFTNWSTGDLGIRDLGAGTSRLLTNKGRWEASGDYTNRSVISPDGTQVAYHWFVQKELRQEIRILPIRGGSPRIFPQGTVYTEPLGWTPDSKQLLGLRAIADKTWQIVMLTLQDGSVHVLKSLGWQDVTPFSLSPDGRYVAYDVPTGDNTQSRDIFVLATDGSTESAVVTHQAHDHSPVWSSDGSRLLFLSDRTGSPSLWSVAIENGKAKGAPELIKSDTGDQLVGMSRNGALFYGVPTRRANVYFSELGSDGKAKAPVFASESFVNHNMGPAISADGRFLAFGSYPTNERGVVIRTLQTGEERAVPPLPLLRGSWAGPQWFPDGRALLLLGRELQKPREAFYRLDLATGKPTLLHSPVTGIRAQGGVSLSLDGTKLYYAETTGNAEDEKRIFRVDLETGRESELIRGARLTALAVSPDNRKIAYLTKVEDTRSIRVMPAGGGASREIYRGFTGAGDVVMTWTPDQRSVVFTTVEGGINNIVSSIWRVPAVGGEAQRMLSVKGQIRNIQVHPDGSKLVFDTIENGSEVWALENFLPNPAGN